MSKSTLAVIAALSASTGAAVTAALFSMRSDRPTATTAATSPVASTAPTRVGAPAPAPAPASSPAPSFSSRKTGPVDPAGLFAYGFPGPVADLAVRSSLVSSYDRRLRNPHWVAEHITPASLAMKDSGADRKNSQFLEDPAVPEKFRARLQDYFRSGYDRGHQVPAADAKWSQAAMDDTFYLTNMCPQVGDGFNRDYWAHFEDFVRRLAMPSKAQGQKTYPSVRVVTGPLYLPKRDAADGKWYVRYEVIGPGSAPSVAVPTHFYKVIFAETDAAAADNAASSTAPVAIGAFVLPNARIPNSTPLSEFEVPLELVERATGLEFAAKLPPQRRRRLCAETQCSVVVREFAERQKQKRS